jgi:hypothetical protein
LSFGFPVGDTIFCAKVSWEIQKNQFFWIFVPSSDADMVNLKYTDSDVHAVSIVLKMLDYASVEFPLAEFSKAELMLLL